jgi:hypothetical protein
LLTEESEDRLIGQYALRWPNGQSLKVGFDFEGANFDNPPAVCPVGMERSTCENAVADAVVETASAWSQYGNIYFRKTSWDEADIRVRFRERGSYSVVGTDAQEKARNEETMNLAFSFLTSPENFRGTILHEFGHVIGLQHEHNSPNVAYHWNEAQIILVTTINSSLNRSVIKEIVCAKQTMKMKVAARPTFSSKPVYALKFFK